MPWISVWIDDHVLQTAVHPNRWNPVPVARPSVRQDGKGSEGKRGKSAGPDDVAGEDEGKGKSAGPHHLPDKGKGMEDKGGKGKSKSPGPYHKGKGKDGGKDSRRIGKNTVTDEDAWVDRRKVRWGESWEDTGSASSGKGGSLKGKDNDETTETEPIPIEDDADADPPTGWWDRPYKS